MSAPVALSGERCRLVDIFGRPLKSNAGYCPTKWLFKMSEFAPKCRHSGWENCRTTWPIGGGK
jgi:hypothetical protein